MSILGADMIEPVIDNEGFKSVLVLHGGFTTTVTDVEIYDESKYSKEERKILFAALNYSSWPLPKNFANYQDYVPKEKDDLSRLHSRIVRYLASYVWFDDDRAYELVANWIISTYFRKDFRYAPILIFDGVTQSGKSTVLKTLREVVYRGTITSNYSAASIARQIEAHNATMLLDESLDNIQSDRGIEVSSLLKSSFEEGNVWIRADPKSTRLHTYHTFTHTAIAVKAEGLPEDVYNRGIRIGMVGMPEDLELADIDSVYEDDAYGDCSPIQLRAELYALKWACLGGVSDDNVPIEWNPFKAKSKDHFTRREETGDWKGEWHYGYVNDIKKAPRIHGRTRNIASTLYSVALATSTEHDTIKMLIENDKANREVIIDTPEALTFSAIVDCILAGWNAEKDRDPFIGNTISEKLFDDLAGNISTTDVGEAFNRILTSQGNAGRDPVQTKTVTAKILALGFTYKRGRQNRSYFDPKHPNFKPFFARYLKMWVPEYTDTFDFAQPEKKLTNTPEVKIPVS